ncbi:MAG: TolC family protein [Bacteroidales bacterium]|nr:TolC family protein [Bacteroidales bacterium]
MKNLIKIIPLLITANTTLPVFSQGPDTIGLYDCYRLVRTNAPQTGLIELNNRITTLEVEKLKSENLPLVSGFGKATYQSEAVSIVFPIPGIAGIEVDKFQYNIGLNIDQKLFDGGLATMQRNIKKIEGEIRNLETETALYKLNDLVIKYFFGTITLQKTVEILGLRVSSLEGRKKNIISGVKNGMVLYSELARIESEIITTAQQIAEIQAEKKQLENKLKILAGINITIDIVWKVPDNIIISNSVSRCETELFQQNQNFSDALIELQNKRYVPRLYAFGQAGYSYPGLNMFENEPAGYYIAGAKLSWLIFDWNQAKKEKQLIKIQKEKIAISETDFYRNLEISINSEKYELEKYNELIKTDLMIIESKSNITKLSASALDNGTITTADYISDLNSEIKARFDYERHKIGLAESIARLALLKGIEIENYK